MIKAGDLLLDPARAEVRARALNPMNKIPILEAPGNTDDRRRGAGPHRAREKELMADTLAV